MSLNHSKTWPVSTMAVVQLRVDPHGRAYSTLHEAAEERDRRGSEAAAAAERVIDQVMRDRVRWQKGRESCTDTVSTVLDDVGDDLSSDRNSHLHQVRKIHYTILDSIAYNR